MSEQKEPELGQMLADAAKAARDGDPEPGRRFRKELEARYSEPLVESEIEALRMCVANATRGDSLGYTESARAAVARLAASALKKLRRVLHG